MGPQFLTIALVAGLGIFAEPLALESATAYAGGDCSAAANKVVSQTGGQLLSAQLKGANCVITVLVPQKDGHPKKITKRVPA